MSQRSSVMKHYLQSIHNHVEEQEESRGEYEPFQQKALDKAVWDSGWQKHLQELVEVMTEWTCDKKSEKIINIYNSSYNSSDIKYLILL